MANTKAIKFSNNGYTYLPVTNSDIVQYSNQGISVTSAIQTLAASSQDTFIDGNESSAVLHIKSVDETTVNKSYTFTGSAAGNGQSAVTVSYANNTITISATYTNTDTKVTSAANHYKGTINAAGSYNLTASGASAAWSIDVVKGVNLSYDAAGHITGMTITSGKIPGNPVPTNNVIRDSTSWNAADYIVLTTATDKTIKKSTYKPTTTSPQSSSDDTTIPTSKAVWGAINGAIGNLTGALIYKGTIDGGSTGAYGALTTAASQGDVYVVSKAGKINGNDVEVGDMLICKATTDAATSSNYTTINDNWNIITGENQWTLTESNTLPSNGTSISPLTIEGKTLTISHGTPTGAVKNASKTTDGPQLTHNSSMVMTGVNWKADGNGHVTEVSYTLAKLPAETQLSRTGTAKTATLTHGGTFTYISNLNVSNHQITYDYTTATLPSQGPDYGKIKVVKHSSATTDDISSSTADVTLTSVNDNELVTFESVNKWLHIKGTNSTTAGSDKVQFSHALSAAGAKSEGLYKIATDAAGHVTSATAASFGAAPTGLKYVTSTTDVEDFTLSGITFETTTVDLAKVFTPTVS